MIHHLKKLLTSPEVYKTKLFPESSFSHYELSILSKRESAFDVAWGNRLLLESIFPIDVMRRLNEVPRDINFEDEDNSNSGNGEVHKYTIVYKDDKKSKLDQNIPDSLKTSTKDKQEEYGKNLIDKCMEIFIDNYIENIEDAEEQQIVRYLYKERRSVRFISEKLDITKYKVQSIKKKTWDICKDERKRMGKVLAEYHFDPDLILPDTPWEEICEKFFGCGAGNPDYSRN